MQSPNNSKKNSGCTQGCNWDESWSWSAALQTEKPWCHLLKFQEKLSKESRVLLGHFHSSWKKPVCPCLHSMPPGHQLQQRWIRLGGSLLRPAALPALRANRSPSALASPGEFILLSHRGSVGHRNVALRQCVLSLYLSFLPFQDGCPTRRSEARGWDPNFVSRRDLRRQFTMPELPLCYHRLLGKSQAINHSLLGGKPTWFGPVITQGNYRIPCCNLTWTLLEAFLPRAPLSLSKPWRLWKPARV